MGSSPLNTWTIRVIFICFASTCRNIDISASACRNIDMGMISRFRHNTSNKINTALYNSDKPCLHTVLQRCHCQCQAVNSLLIRSPCVRINPKSHTMIVTTGQFFPWATRIGVTIAVTTNYTQLYETQCITYGARYNFTTNFSDSKPRARNSEFICPIEINTLPMLQSSPDHPSRQSQVELLHVPFPEHLDGHPVEWKVLTNWYSTFK